MCPNRPSPLPLTVTHSYDPSDFFPSHFSEFRLVLLIIHYFAIQYNFYEPPLFFFSFFLSDSIQFYIYFLKPIELNEFTRGLWFKYISIGLLHVFITKRAPLGTSIIFLWWEMKVVKFV